MAILFVRQLELTSTTYTWTTDIRNGTDGSLISSTSWWDSTDRFLVGKIISDSAGNFYATLGDMSERDRQYLVKFDSSGNFIHEKKLPPNLYTYNISIKSNPEGTEQFIYFSGQNDSGAHNHTSMYGTQLNSYNLSGMTGRYSADATPVTSTPGYAEINVSQ